MREPRALIRPRPLQPGDRIALVAPASTFDRDELAHGAAILESWGLVVEVPPPGPNLRYLAGSDDERAGRLTEAFERSDVAAIMGIRGGYGSARLFGRFDAGVAAAHPKLFIGYSDLTILLWRLRSEAGLVAFHGPMAASDLPHFETDQLERFRRFLFGEEGWWAGGDVVGRAPGTATGPLVGGCLSVIVTTIGTPYEIDTRGAVLFLEDVGEASYRIDRMLTQLLHAGKLKEVAAVVLGSFHGCDRIEAPGEVLAVCDEILGRLGVPVVSNFDAGHKSGGAVLPMGCEVRVDSDAGRIELLEPVFTSKPSPAGVAGRPGSAPAAKPSSPQDLARIAAAAARRGPGFSSR